MTEETRGPFWSTWALLPRIAMTVLMLPIMWLLIAALMGLMVAIYPVAHIWWGTKDWAGEKTVSL